MFFQKFKTPGIAHVAYLVGNGTEAAIVDPRRDVEEYVQVARANGLSIRWLIETHRQEDFVLGSARLAELTGAQIVTGDHELFGRSDVRLKDGEDFTFADLRLRALHTPGHTPESTCYALFLEAAPETALGVFTGDTLFIGETGRTDLPDRTRTGENAGLLFDAVRAKLAPLGDQALVWPAHGSGSVCGGNIAPRDDSTLGIERASNPVFNLSRDAFVAAKIDERIPRPPYFKHMERVNLQGGMAAPKSIDRIPLLDPERLAAERKKGIVLDLREPEAFAAGHIPDSVNVWLQGLPVFAGWLVDETTKVYLVLPEMSDLQAAVTHLARVGIDDVAGVLAGGFGSWRDAGRTIACLGTLDARRLERELAQSVVLDVRDDSEFEKKGHIPGAYHLYVGYLDDHLERIRAELEGKPLVVTCSVGHRAGIAVSLLQRRGFKHVSNLLGGMKAWTALELRTEKGAERSVSTPAIEGTRS